jgi:hypothetical protein
MMSSSLGGMSRLKRTAGGGSESRIALKMSAEVSPWNGNDPVAISYSTAPNENKSVRESSSFPFACSGDIYATVPSVLPGLVR